MASLNEENVMRSFNNSNKPFDRNQNRQRNNFGDDQNRRNSRWSDRRRDPYDRNDDRSGGGRGGYGPPRSNMSPDRQGPPPPGNMRGSQDWGPNDDFYEMNRGGGGMFNSGGRDRFMRGLSPRRGGGNFDNYMGRPPMSNNFRGGGGNRQRGGFSNRGNAGREQWNNRFPPRFGNDQQRGGPFRQNRRNWNDDRPPRNSYQQNKYGDNENGAQFGNTQEGSDSDWEMEASKEETGVVAPTKDRNGTPLRDELPESQDCVAATPASITEAIVPPGEENAAEI